MNQPQILRPQLPKPPRRTILPILLAFSLFLMVSTVFVLLSMGTFGLVLLVAGGVFLVIAFHYVVWGWWLRKIIHKDQDEQQHADSKHARQDFDAN